MDTAKPTRAKPHWHFSAKLPLVRNPYIRRPWLVTKCSFSIFGPINSTWTLFIFGWSVCSWERLEWHNKSDKERAERYLNEWSKCEKELRGLRLLQLGDEVPDPETRKLLRESLGIDLDEGRLL